MFIVNGGSGMKRISWEEFVQSPVFFFLNILLRTFKFEIVVKENDGKLEIYPVSYDVEEGSPEAAECLVQEADRKVRVDNLFKALAGDY